METARFGRAGRPGSRLREHPADAKDALGQLFAELPRFGEPPPRVVVEPAGRERSVAPGHEPATGATHDVAGRPPAAEHDPPAAPLRLWWDDPRHRRPLPAREARAHPSDDWPRPVLPPDAPPPPYEGCRWPRACAVLGRRLSCLSLLPCRCLGGELVVRSAARSATRDGETLGIGE